MWNLHGIFIESTEPHKYVGSLQGVPCKGYTHVNSQKECPEQEMNGQSSDISSWIWRTGKVSEHEQEDAFLQEGK